MRAEPAFRSGWWRDALRRDSPHCDARPSGCAIDLVVLHNISLPPGRFGGPFIDALFLGCLDTGADQAFAGLAGLRVSAHFLVRREGQVVQYVSCAQRAWHAGASTHRGRTRCNDFSVGIELEGSDHEAFEPAQYETLARLLLEREVVDRAALDAVLGASGERHTAGAELTPVRESVVAE